MQQDYHSTIITIVCWLASDLILRNKTPQWSTIFQYQMWTQHLYSEVSAMIFPMLESEDLDNKPLQELNCIRVANVLDMLTKTGTQDKLKSSVYVDCWVASRSLEEINSRNLSTNAWLDIFPINNVTETSDLDIVLDWIKIDLKVSNNDTFSCLICINKD